MGAQEEQNKLIVRRLFDEVWNVASPGPVVEALYAPDFVSDYLPYATGRGPEGIRSAVAASHATFPDYHEELLDLIAEGDRVLVHMRISGTQEGAWGPIPPTGRRVVFEEFSLLTFRDGQAVHQRGIVDNLSMLRQLGVVPTPPGQAAARE